MEAKEAKTGEAVPVTPPARHAEAEAPATLEGAQTPAEFKAAVAAYSEKRRVLREFLRSELEPGIDYGLVHRKTKIGPRDYQPCRYHGQDVMRNEAGDIIPCPACGAKPLLWKPGAEKVVSLLRLTASYEVDGQTMDVLGLRGKSIAFRCLLLDRASGHIVAEGRGAADLGVRGRDANATIKMAKKSALIDAVLNVGALSGAFTQDIEDMEPAQREEYEAPPSHPAGRSDNGSRSRGTDVPPCPRCGGPMWDNRAEREQDKRDIEAGKRKKKPRAAFRCKDKKCDGVIWSASEGATAPEAAEPAPAAATPAEERHADIENERARTCVCVFEDMGVPRDILEAKMARVAGAWTDDDLARLGEVYKAIRDGKTTVEAEFGVKQPF